MKVSELGEFGLIKLLADIVNKSANIKDATADRLLQGIGDDTAVWKTEGPLQLATTDSLIQDTHFNLDNADNSERTNIARGLSYNLEFQVFSSSRSQGQTIQTELHDLFADWTCELDDSDVIDLSLESASGIQEDDPTEETWQFVSNFTAHTWRDRINF